MEKRTLKVLFSKNGNGFKSYRINLPTPWVEDLGITEDDREVNVYKLAERIVIMKEEMKMDAELAYEEIIKKCNKEIKDGFICDSDNTDRFVDMEVRDTIIALSNEDDEEDNKDDYLDELIERVHDYLDKNYKMVSDNTNGNFVGYWYDNKFNFEDVAELEKHFGIGI